MRRTSTGSASVAGAVARSRITGPAAQMLAGSGVAPGQIVALGFEVPGGDQFWTQVRVRAFEQRKSAAGTSVAVVVEDMRGG